MSNTVSFTKVKLPNGWLGNMAPYPVTYNGLTYRTTEALFQALRFADHPEVQTLIQQEKSPMSAKMVAKKYKHLLPDDTFLGESDKERMRTVLKLKIDQHPELKKELLATRDKTIIEDCTARPRGTGLFWGAQLKDGVWQGENVLGVLWMELRKQLKANTQ